MYHTQVWRERTPDYHCLQSWWRVVCDHFWQELALKLALRDKRVVAVQGTEETCEG